MNTIRQPAIPKTASLQGRPSKTCPKIGFAPSAAWTRAISSQPDRACAQFSGGPASLPTLRPCKRRPFLGSHLRPSKNLVFRRDCSILPLALRARGRQNAQGVGWGRTCRPCPRIKSFFLRTFFDRLRRPFLGGRLCCLVFLSRLLYSLRFSPR